MTYVKTNNKHSEVITKRSILNTALIPFFGNYALDQITALSVEKFKAQCLQRGLKNKTVNNYLTVLNRCLGSAQEWQVIEKMPRIQLLKVPPPETSFLTLDECQKILSAADPIMYEMIFTALHTGVRFGELIAIKWEDVDFEHRTLTIQRSFARGVLGSTKSNKIRKIPLGNELASLLRTKIRTSDFIFTNTVGKPMGQANCWKKIIKLAKQAGVRKIGWHIFRHTAASYMTNQGVVIQTVQELLGHSDIRTSQRYSHLASVTLVNAVNTLDKYLLGNFWTQGGHKRENSDLLKNGLENTPEQKMAEVKQKTTHAELS